MKPRQFERRALLLFFIISLIPALTVSVLWYLRARDLGPGAVFADVHGVVVPISLMGLIPAIALSLIFSELLARPMRQLGEAITQLAKHNFGYQQEVEKGTEFADLTSALNTITVNLRRLFKQLEEENRLSQAQRNVLTAVLDAMGEGVVALDNRQKIILFNQAACNISGRGMSSFTDHHLDDALPLRKNSKAVVRQWVEDQAGRDPDFREWPELSLQLPDGSQATIAAQAVTVTGDPNGLRTLISIRDMTKLHQLEEMKIDFVALAAHELRTPLAAMRGYLDLLRLEAAKKLTADQRTYLERSAVSADQLAGLVDNLLNVARIERGELNYAFEETDWAAFVDQIVQNLQPHFQQQGRKLTVLIPKDLPKVRVDRLAMQEVLDNLLDNAINHTGKGSRITLKIEKSPTAILTTVSDNGPGIPKTLLPKLFTKFYRIEGLRGGRGTGLGLYISKAITEAHHGYIWVDSQEGKGATFGFSLPTAAEFAKVASVTDNETNAVLRGAHGWIKQRQPEKHPNHRR